MERFTMKGDEEYFNVRRAQIRLLLFKNGDNLVRLLLFFTLEWGFNSRNSS